jgi:hypothetical protein
MGWSGVLENLMDRRVDVIVDIGGGLPPLEPPVGGG